MDKEFRNQTRTNIDILIFETEKKIHLAIRDDNTEFLNWFFFTCSDKTKFDKLLDNQNFNNKEKEYLRNFLLEMGKI